MRGICYRRWDLNIKTASKWRKRLEDILVKLSTASVAELDLLLTHL